MILPAAGSRPRGPSLYRIAVEIKRAPRRRRGRSRARTMSAMTRQDWWGTYELADGEIASWRLGSLELKIRRGARELQVGWQRGAEELDGWSFEPGMADALAAEDLERFLFAGEAGSVRLRPALADRSVVSSPRMPLHILPGEEATLYVGTPLWVRIESKPHAGSLLELPIRRPSDTWFGPSTREGELCYASRTYARLDRENLPRAWRHAITPLLVRNRADEALHLHKIQLPVPLLSLYQGEDGLWTERLALVRTEEGETAEVDVRRGPPAEARGAERLTAPRAEHRKGLLIHAFGRLLSGFSEYES